MVSTIKPTQLDRFEPLLFSDVSSLLGAASDWYFLNIVLMDTIVFGIINGPNYLNDYILSYPLSGLSPTRFEYQPDGGANEGIIFTDFVFKIAQISKMRQFRIVNIQNKGRRITANLRAVINPQSSAGF